MTASARRGLRHQRSGDQSEGLRKPCRASRRGLRPYPNCVVELVEAEMRFRPGTVHALLAFASSRPWSGSVQERMAKFRRLNDELASAYGLATPELRFGLLGERSSKGSCYSRQDHRILLMGKLSVVTYLHEFAHALGKDEVEACRWSINLFRRCFRREYSRLIHRGHRLIRAADVRHHLAGMAGRRHGRDG